MIVFEFIRFVKCIYISRPCDINALCQFGLIYTGFLHRPAAAQLVFKSKKYSKFFSTKAYFFFLFPFSLVSYVVWSYNNLFAFFIKSCNDLIFFVSFLIKSSFFLLAQLLDYTAIHSSIDNFFELIIQASSFRFNSYVSIHFFIYEESIVESLTCYFNSVQWAEREIFDMYGIFFSDNFDLRRLLTDYGFYGYPLRKDFSLLGYYELFYSDSCKSIIIADINIKNVK